MGGADVLLGDLKNLGHEYRNKQEEKARKKEAAKGKHGENAGAGLGDTDSDTDQDTEPATTTTKKWNFEKGMNKAHSQMEDRLKTIREELCKAESESNAVSKLAGVGVQDRSYVRGEEMLLRTKYAAVVTVLATPLELEKYLEKYRATYLPYLAKKGAVGGSQLFSRAGRS